MVIRKIISSKGILDDIKIILSYVVKMPLIKHELLIKNKFPQVLGMPSYDTINLENEEKFKNIIKLVLKNFSQEIQDIKIHINKEKNNGILIIECSVGIIEFVMFSFDDIIS